MHAINEYHAHALGISYLNEPKDISCKYDL